MPMLTSRGTIAKGREIEYNLSAVRIDFTRGIALNSIQTMPTSSNGRLATFSNGQRMWTPGSHSCNGQPIKSETSSKSTSNQSSYSEGSESQRSPLSALVAFAMATTKQHVGLTFCGMAEPLTNRDHCNIVAPAKSISAS